MSRLGTIFYPAPNYTWLRELDVDPKYAGMDDKQKLDAINDEEYGTGHPSGMPNLHLRLGFPRGVCLHDLEAARELYP